MRAKPKKCSWCYAVGHNKAGCEMQRHARTKYIARNAKYRQRCLDVMVEQGLGIGALVEMKLWSWDKPMPCMIENIYWDSFRVGSGISGLGEFEIVPMNVTDPRSSERYGVSVLNKLWAPDRGVQPNYYVQLLSAAAPNTILNSVPPDWLNGESGILWQHYRYEY